MTDERPEDREKPEISALLQGLGSVLEERVESVKASTRLKSSAACLVTPDGGLSPQMERMMKAMGQDVPGQKRTLELNPDHALVKKLNDLAAKDAEDARLKEFGELLYDQALLSEGGQLENPAQFARRVADLMAQVL